MIGAREHVNTETLFHDIMPRVLKIIVPHCQGRLHQLMEKDANDPEDAHYLII